MFSEKMRTRTTRMIWRQRVLVCGLGDLEPSKIRLFALADSLRRGKLLGPSFAFELDRVTVI
jgi:hypothetical protein